jgi:hypothetical protein
MRQLLLIDLIHKLFHKISIQPENDEPPTLFLRLHVIYLNTKPGILNHRKKDVFGILH